MAPITREQALENALASSRIEGYEVTEQTRADCRRLMDGKVDARTLAAEILSTPQGAAVLINTSQLARHAGYVIDFACVDPDDLMIATIQAAGGVDDFLKELFDEMISE